MFDIMLKKLNPTDIQTNLIDWFSNDILTIDFGVQFVIIALAFTVSKILTNIVRPRLNEQINKLTIPFRISEILYSSLRFIFPIVTIIIIAIGTRFAVLITPDISITFATVITKILFAFIFIRFVGQFIEHKLARNIISFTVLALVTLSLFGVLDQTMGTLDAIGFNIGEFRLSALSVLKGMFIIFILLYGALFLSKLTEKKISQTRSLTPSSRVLISKITKVFLVVSALLIGLTSAGIDLSLLAVFSGAVGLGIGFGLQKVISNLFSGMLLLLDQSIKPGDIIEMDGTFG